MSRRRTATAWSARGRRAEDLVQETYLRAWRSHSTFEGRSSLRTWLYRIATNARLSALGQRCRRVLPRSGRSGRRSRCSAGSGGARGGVAGAGAGRCGDPRDRRPRPRLSRRVTAATGARRHPAVLPACQRAELLLREVLRFSAGEVAAVLGVSTAAVKSASQGARDRLDEVAPSPESVVEPVEPRARGLSRQYYERNTDRMFPVVISKAFPPRPDVLVVRCTSWWVAKRRTRPSASGIPRASAPRVPASACECVSWNANGGDLPPAGVNVLLTVPTSSRARCRPPGTSGPVVPAVVAAGRGGGGRRTRRRTRGRSAPSGCRSGCCRGRCRSAGPACRSR